MEFWQGVAFGAGVVLFGVASWHVARLKQRADAGTQEEAAYERRIEELNQFEMETPDDLAPLLRWLADEIDNGLPGERILEAWYRAMAQEQEAQNPHPVPTRFHESWWN